MEPDGFSFRSAPRNALPAPVLLRADNKTSTCRRTSPPDNHSVFQYEPKKHKVLNVLSVTFEYCYEAPYLPPPNATMGASTSFLASPASRPIAQLCSRMRSLAMPETPIYINAIEIFKCKDFRDIARMNIKLPCAACASTRLLIVPRPFCTAPICVSANTTATVSCKE
jgi:hypothetical protein